MNDQTYLVTFERVGRHGGRNGSTPPAPVTITANGSYEAAEAVVKAARPYLASRGVEAVVDLDEGRGEIHAGFRIAGTFTIEPAQAVSAR